MRFPQSLSATFGQRLGVIIGARGNRAFAAKSPKVVLAQSQDAERVFRHLASIFANPLFQIGSEMNEQVELTAMSETVTPRTQGSRNPRPIHGFADYGPILGVITLDYVQGFIESLDCDPLSNEEIRDFVGLSRMYDRYPTFSEIIEDVRLSPLHYPPSSDVTDQFRYLWHHPSSLGDILDVFTLDEVEKFLGSNGHAPLTEAERFCFAFYFVGHPTLFWVDDIVNKIRPEIGRIIHAAEPNQFCQVNDEAPLSADDLGLPRIVVGVDGELHIEEIDRSGTRCA